jgi:DNA replication and repair protein RecF
MYINRISLANFRNYKNLDLELGAGPTLLYGDNAQGKTNLLEAIYYLATTRSPHSDHGRQLINWEAMESELPITVGRIVAHVESDKDTTELEMRLISEYKNGKNGFRREALVNRRKVRLMDLLGKLRMVLFLPQDLELVTGSPSRRRRYLDITLCQTDRKYCRALATYNRVLEQRNALLRQIGEQGTGLDVLPVYTEKLVEAGSQLFYRRSETLKSLDKIAGLVHESQLTDGGETLHLQYFPRLRASNKSRSEEINGAATWLHEQDTLEGVAIIFQEELELARELELASGYTVIGPHRDDWGFRVDGRDLNRFGSRGQQRTALLALKLSEIEWITGETGESPVLLLDEVVAELDSKRRARLLETIRGNPQSILTATDPKMFSEEFLATATIMQVVNGEIIPVTRNALATP